jgi:hypothetical protein
MSGLRKPMPVLRAQAEQGYSPLQCEPRGRT